MSIYILRISRFSQIIRFLSISRLFLWMIWVMYREHRRVIRAHAQSISAAQPASSALIQALVAFRNTAVKQGVLLIKLGQFLSTRVDVLTEQAIAVLSSLQDEVPPAPFAYAVFVIESELGKHYVAIFVAFSENIRGIISLF
jgi:predicted unusual protein kinase regulating ubiquinone biosynthesis (AarF/ABC1/UbiB family)